jgi:hypothetical protein
MSRKTADAVLSCETHSPNAPIATLLSETVGPGRRGWPPSGIEALAGAGAVLGDNGF